MSATIYRDTFGVPHVFADSDAQAAFAVGYAQAEDRLEALLRNYRLAEGRLAEIDGPAWIEHDFEKRLLHIPAIAREGYARLSARVRELVDAYVSGVERFMQTHPTSVPDWAEVPRGEQVVALSYWLTVQWCLGDVKQELESSVKDTSHYSNAWAVSPQRSADHCALLLIDPHVPWNGTYRWYELHIHADTLHCAGFAICGTPLPALGFNRSLGWATTVGGPDCADLFAVRLDRKSERYHLGHETRRLHVEPCQVKVSTPHGLVMETQDHLYCDLGPIVQTEDSLGFAMHLAYQGQTGLLEQLYRMNVAADSEEFTQALRLLQFPPMNFIFGDREGNIGYWLNGRCPRRDGALDWTSPVSADDPRSHWQELHDLDELPHLINPPCGFVQNCNVTPDRVAPHAPLQRDSFPRYMFYTHDGDVYRPRSERALELLSRTSPCSINDMMLMAMDKKVLSARAWVRALANACEGRVLTAAAQEGMAALKAWDGHADAHSAAAAIFARWRNQFQNTRPHVSPSNEHHHIPFSDEAQEIACRTFLMSVEYLVNTFGKVDVPLGEIQRLRRTERAYPLGGGGVWRLGLECLRAIECEDPDETGRATAVAGNSCPTIVKFCESVEAFSVVPFGQSDDPQRPHFADQSPLFSREEFKLMRFEWDQLRGCVDSETQVV